MGLLRRVFGGGRGQDDGSFRAAINQMAQIRREVQDRRTALTDPSGIKHALPGIIDACLSEIQRHPKNGDAYVTLADAYFMTARATRDPAAYDQLSAFAAAILTHSADAELAIHRDQLHIFQGLMQQVATAVGVKLGKEGRVGSDQVEAVQAEIRMLRQQHHAAAISPTALATARQALN